MSGEGFTSGMRMKHRIPSQAIGPCWCLTPTHRLLVQAVTRERVLKNMDSQKVTLRATWGARLEFQEVPRTRGWLFLPERLDVMKRPLSFHKKKHVYCCLLTGKQLVLRSLLQHPETIARLGVRMLLAASNKTPI